MIKKLLAILSVVLFANQASAAEYFCKVDAKWSSGQQYSSQHLLKWKPAVKIDDKGGYATLYRCSYETSADAVTCDRYSADYVTQDFNGNKKYYQYNGQFDVQLFANLDFIENNGRGTISMGKCKLVRP